MKKFRFIIIVIIILFALVKILENHNAKVSEELRETVIKLRIEKAKDTVALIPLVPEKKINSL